MKKALVIILVLFIGLSGLTSQMMGDPDRDLFKVMFNDDPQLSGPGNTVLWGFGTELLGYGLFLSGGLVISLDFYVGLGLYEVGGLMMPIGGLVVQSGLSSYQDALTKKGASLDDNFRSDSWMWTYVSVALGAGGFAMYIISGDSFELLIGSVIVVGVGAIVEVCNMQFIRMDWVAALNKAAREIGITGINVTCPIAVLETGWGLEISL